jgi:hypothetical protein
MTALIALLLIGIGIAGFVILRGRPRSGNAGLTALERPSTKDDMLLL